MGFFDDLISPFKAVYDTVVKPVADFAIGNVIRPVYDNVLAPIVKPVFGLVTGTVKAAGQVVSGVGNGVEGIGGLLSGQWAPYIFLGGGAILLFVLFKRGPGT